MVHIKMYLTLVSIGGRCSEGDDSNLDGLAVSAHVHDLIVHSGSADRAEITVVQVHCRVVHFHPC